MVTLDTVQKKKTMKKESGFKLRSGNKPSPAKIFGALAGQLKKRGGAARGVVGALRGKSGKRFAAGGLMKPVTLGAIGGAVSGVGRQIPGNPAGPRRGRGFLGGAMSIATGSRRSGGSRRRRNRFGGLLSRFM